MKQINGIDLYNDGIGHVEYVEHMGSDLSIVNSARVSFGKHKQELDGKDKKLIKYLIKPASVETFFVPFPYETLADCTIDVSSPM